MNQGFSFPADPTETLEKAEKRLHNSSKVLEGHHSRGTTLREVLRGSARFSEVFRG